MRAHVLGLFPAVVVVLWSFHQDGIKVALTQLATAERAPRITTTSSSTTSGKTSVAPADPATAESTTSATKSQADSSIMENEEKVTGDATLPHQRDNQLLKVTLKKNSQGKPLEFVHIPKTGGTAMEVAAARQNVTWGMCHYRVIGAKQVASIRNPALKLEEEFPGCRRKLPRKTGFEWCGKYMVCWHHAVEQIQNHPGNEIYTNKALFAVIRNPYTKIVSEYYCPFQGRGFHKGKELNWFVQTVLNGYKKKRLNEGERLHMKPQAEYVFHNHTQQQIEHVVFYEDLSAQIETLMMEYDLPVRMGKVVNGGTQNGTKSTRLTFADLDPESIALINEVYAEDFELLGYQKMDPFFNHRVHALEAYNPKSIYMVSS